MLVTGLTLNGATIAHPGVSFATPINLLGRKQPHIRRGRGPNGDGKTDLVVANDAGEGTLSVLLGDGGGGFPSPATYGVGGASSLAVADLNGDGRPDVTVAYASGYRSPSPTATIEVLLNSGNGGLVRSAAYSQAEPYAVSFAVADVNGDGKPDQFLAALGRDMALHGVALVSARLRDEHGTLMPNSLFDDWQCPGVSYVTVETIAGAACRHGLHAEEVPEFRSLMIRHVPSNHHDWIRFRRFAAGVPPRRPHGTYEDPHYESTAASS